MLNRKTKSERYTVKVVISIVELVKFRDLRYIEATSDRVVGVAVREHT